MYNIKYPVQHKQPIISPNYSINEFVYNRDAS